MIPSFTGFPHSIRLLSALLLFFSVTPAFAASESPKTFQGASYSASPNKADYRSVTTLNEFTLLVYKERWKEIRYDDLMPQLEQFKGAAYSPAMREIWRDILLGDFNELRIREGKEQSTLAAKRIELLNRLGYFNEAVRLYGEVSKLKPIPEIVAIQGVEALALSGSADGACLEVYMASNHLDSQEWKQDKALCALYFGEKDMAEDLYAQVKENTGSGFRTVYQMLNKETDKAINVGIPPLWRTLLLAQKAQVTSQAIKQADAMTLASLAINKRVPLGTRLIAANRAADMGTFGSDQLRKLYELKHPANSGLDAIIEGAKNGSNMPQSDYYAAARFTFDGKQRAAIVKNALRHMDPETNVKGHVYSWIADKLTLQIKQLGWFAPEGYTLLAATNRLPSATMYFKEGHLEKSRFAIIDALLQGNPWPKAQQELWQDAMKQYYKKNADERIRAAFDLAIAYDMEKKLALDIDSKTASNKSGNASVLKDSIRKGGRGVTLVSALNILANTKHLKDIPTDQFIDIIDVMTKEGLFRERKKIALEFLIQNML